MQKSDKPRTRPVQLRFAVHKALKKLGAATEMELGLVVEDALMQNPVFRDLLEKEEGDQ